MKKYKVIYLDEEDKEKIQKQAQKKQLSLSTYVEIIIYNLQKIMETEKAENLQSYIHKGKKQIYIKPKTNRCYIKVNVSMNVIYTNIIYLFLHQDILKTYLDEKEIKKSLKNIQSESDKKYDPRFDYNNKIRMEYQLIKKITKEINKNEPRK